MENLLQQAYNKADDLRESDVDYAKNNYIAEMCWIYLNKQSECLYWIEHAKQVFKEQPDKIDDAIDINFDTINGSNTGYENLSFRSHRNEIFSYKADRKTSSLIFKLHEGYLFFENLKDEYPKSVYPEIGKLELDFYDDEQTVLKKINNFWDKHENELTLIYKKDARAAF